MGSGHFSWLLLQKKVPLFHLNTTGSTALDSCSCHLDGAGIPPPAQHLRSTNLLHLRPLIFRCHTEAAEVFGNTFQPMICAISI